MAYRSVNPFFESNMQGTSNYFPRLWDQYFGSDLFNKDSIVSMLCQGTGLRPRPQTAMQPFGHSEVKDGKDKFKVMLNVSQFKAKEVEVKTVDNYIVIHAKHEERTDEHGFIQREFTRRYMLPEGSEKDNVKSSLSANGILIVEVPKKTRETSSSNERIVPITLSKA